jgi:glycosyltransferase involved in cell wall biosynthesis
MLSEFFGQVSNRFATSRTRPLRASNFGSDSPFLSLLATEKPSKPLNRSIKRIAVVHEWLSGYFGSERVVEQILQLYPQADVFCVADFLPPDERTFLNNRPVTTSFIQRLPLARRHFRKYLPLMPLAVEQFDLSSYDLVISSSHAVAKGVLTHPQQLHISYVHTPMRYAWDMQEQYLGNGQANGAKGTLARALLHYVRMWDVRTANGVDVFVANSDFVARRIWKIYRREAAVVYPPVDVASFGLVRNRKSFYLTVSRMVPYKRIDLIVDAFSRMPDRQLVVIGEGPELSKLRSKATSNVTILGYQAFEAILNHLQQARAFIFAAEEDFGIAPLEAQACGTPVIAFEGGGATETVIDGVTGAFFAEQTAESLIQAVNKFECAGHHLDPDRIRRHAERFSNERFRREFADLVEHEHAAFMQYASRPVSKSFEYGTNVLDGTNGRNGIYGRSRTKVSVPNRTIVSNGARLSG